MEEKQIRSKAQNKKELPTLWKLVNKIRGKKQKPEQNKQTKN